MQPQVHETADPWSPPLPPRALNIDERRCVGKDARFSPAVTHTSAANVEMLRTELGGLCLSTLLGEIFAGGSAIHRTTFVRLVQRALGAASEVEDIAISFLFTALVDATPGGSQNDEWGQLLGIKTATAALSSLCGRERAVDHRRAVDQIFKVFDARECGKLERSSVAFFLHSLLSITYRLLDPSMVADDVKFRRISTAMTDRLFNEMDSDHSGAIDRGEFECWIDETLGLAVEEEEEEEGGRGRGGGGGALRGSYRSGRG